MTKEQYAALTEEEREARRKKNREWMRAWYREHTEEAR